MGHENASQAQRRGKQLFSALVFLALSCLLLVGADALSWKLKEKSAVMPDPELSVGVYLLPESLTRSGAQFVMKNWSGVAVLYGEDYTLEKFSYNEWYPVEPKGDLIFHTVGYLLAPGKEQIISVDWSRSFGGLPDGSYRLVKEFSVERGPLENRDYIDFTKTAEFTIS